MVDNSDFENRDLSAEWMAVRHADRAVFVAWVSAFVNLLVVIVALGTPVLQHWIDRREVVDTDYARKAALIAEARKIYFDGVIGRSSFDVVLKPDLYNRDNVSKNLRSELLDETDYALSNLADELKFVFNKESDDINYRNLVSTLMLRIYHLRVATKRMRFIVKNEGDKGIESLKNAQNKFQDQYDNDLRLIRLLIEINTDRGRGFVAAGEVRYETCFDPENLVSCARPLKESDV